MDVNQVVNIAIEGREWLLYSWQSGPNSEKYPPAVAEPRIKEINLQILELKEFKSNNKVD